MKFRTLGHTGLSISVLGLGTYQFGGRWGKDFTQNDADAIIDAAREEKINFIDTAACYGPHLSERLIGSAILKDRDKWILATKFGHHRIDKNTNEQRWSADDVRGQLEESLAFLKTDYIDIYQFHSGSNDVFDNDELWTMLSKQVDAGKIRFLGISLSRLDREYRVHQAEKARSVGVDVIQVLYNKLIPEAEDEVLDICIRDKLGVLARVPLASGLLTGKYKPGHRFSEDDARYEKFAPKELDRLLRKVERIRDKEIPDGIPMQHWSLVWPLKHPGVSAVLAGVKNTEHLHDNCKALDLI